MKIDLRRLGLGILVLALAGPGMAATFQVNEDGSALDDNVGDGNCHTANNGCTLHAAIQEANATAGFDTIQFLIPKVTLANTLPNISESVLIDGTTQPLRAEIDGNGNGCFFMANVLPSGGTPDPLFGNSNNSRIQHLSIHGCGGDAIDINGHGYVVMDNYIGLLPDGTTADANSGDGIYVSASQSDGALLDPSLIPVPLPSNLQDVASMVAFLLANAASLQPNGIVNNVISGNDGNGIQISGMYAATTVVANNMIGADSSGLIPLPNGNGSPRHGIFLNANTYLNFIGPNNTVVASHDDGININTSRVPFPNFVFANFIGTSSQSAFLNPLLGNSLSGIKVADAGLADTGAGDSFTNPTGISAAIGPGNIVGWNKGDNGSVAAGNKNGIEGGIVVSGGNSNHVKIFGNVVGLSAPGSSAVSIGNTGDGINVVGTDHEIGGSSYLLGNVVGGNGRHGVVVRGNATRTVVRGNLIGTLPPPLNGVSQPNTGYGIWLLSGGNTIGDDDPNGANYVAYNNEHAIKLDTTGNTWADLIRHNSIYGLPAGKLGIDLDRPANGPDSTSDTDDRDTSGTTYLNYANWQQNA